MISPAPSGVQHFWSVAAPCGYERQATQCFAHTHLKVKRWLGTLRQIKKHIMERLLQKPFNSLRQRAWGTNCKETCRDIWSDREVGEVRVLCPVSVQKDGPSESIWQWWPACRVSAGGRQLHQVTVTTGGCCPCCTAGVWGRRCSIVIFWEDCTALLLSSGHIRDLVWWNFLYSLALPW